ncbi:hypothetical protein SHJG_4736 [Streptomyces hygroscopicus subsp. jinggangensis 5008]|nr:hypothetical protein SHJG_4736 [Streptomyces hygroscopicus subsp. jinggangensis 5008]
MRWEHLAQGQVPGEHRAGLEQPGHGQRRRDARRAGYQGDRGDRGRHAGHQDRAAGAEQPRPGPQAVQEGADGGGRRHHREQRARPADADAALFEQGGQDEFGEGQQGQAGRAGDVHRPGAGQQARLRRAPAVPVAAPGRTAVPVRRPAGREQPQARGGRRHQGGGEQRREAGAGAEGEPRDGGRGDGPDAEREHRLGGQRLGRRVRRHQGGEPRAQPAGRGGGPGPGEEREGGEQRRGRAGERAEARESGGARAESGGQVRAGPPGVQAHAEQRGADDLADDVGGGEGRAQGVAAGALADQEDQGQRGHGHRHTGADGHQGPGQDRPGDDIAVAHASTVGAATDNRRPLVPGLWTTSAGAPDGGSHELTPGRVRRHARACRSAPSCSYGPDRCGCTWPGTSTATAIRRRGSRCAARSGSTRATWRRSRMTRSPSRSSRPRSRTCGCPCTRCTWWRWGCSRAGTGISKSCPQPVEERAGTRSCCRRCPSRSWARRGHRWPRWRSCERRRRRVRGRRRAPPQPPPPPPPSRARAAVRYDPHSARTAVSPGPRRPLAADRRTPA